MSTSVLWRVENLLSITWVGVILYWLCPICWLTYARTSTAFVTGGAGYVSRMRILLCTCWASEVILNFRTQVRVPGEGTQLHTSHILHRKTTSNRQKVPKMHGKVTNTNVLTQTFNTFDKTFLQLNKHCTKCSQLCKSGLCMRNIKGTKISDDKKSWFLLICLRLRMSTSFFASNATRGVRSSKFRRPD